MNKRVKEDKKLQKVQGSKYRQQKQRKMEIKKRRNQLHEERKRVAHSLRIQRKHNDQKKMDFVNDLRMKKACRINLTNQGKRANEKVQEMKEKQVAKAKSLNRDIVLNEKELIRKRELEAQKLEKLEAELLQNLMQTQNMEKEAFTQLEQAMINASKSKRHRVNNSRGPRRSKKHSKKIVL